jgi:HD-GYP domain-containing protein (c-di-GMP phosphodiesterase class II)
MYVDRTESSVAELRRMNTELQLANQEVQRASWEIHHLNMELLEMLAKIIDARDPDTSGDALNVGDYAVAIGRQFSLSEERIEGLRWAGMLHDIGKLGVPDNILFKPAALTNDEYEQVKKHAALGGDLLETVQGLTHLVPFVRHHHERWDGKGYPAGLAGEKIPLEALILAVCDSAEAMAAARPYKKEFSQAQVIAELRRCSGGQFDPAIAEAFILELPTKALKSIDRSNTIAQTKTDRAAPDTPSPVEETSILSPSLQPSPYWTFANSKRPHDEMRWKKGRMSDHKS